MAEVCKIFNQCDRHNKFYVYRLTRSFFGCLFCGHGVLWHSHIFCRYSTGVKYKQVNIFVCNCFHQRTIFPRFPL